MHASALAFESPFLLALMALFGTAIWLMLWWHTRTRYMLPLAFGWALLCVYWSLAAISAGPAPIIMRSEIVLMIRVTGILAAVTLEGGKLWMLWMMWRNGKAKRGE